MRTLTALALAFMLASAPAFAQSAPTPTPAAATTSAPAAAKPMAPMLAPPAMTDATRDFMAADHKMHNAMMLGYNGDADADFVRHMIPHHQGAVDMAQVELKYGKDPDMKKFAQKIIDDQNAEIKMMQDWLKKHK